MNSPKPIHHGCVYLLRDMNPRTQKATYTLVARKRESLHASLSKYPFPIVVMRRFPTTRPKTRLRQMLKLLQKSTNQWVTGWWPLEEEQLTMLLTIPPDVLKRTIQPRVTKSRETKTNP